MESLQQSMSDSISRDLTKEDLNSLAAIADEHAVAFSVWCEQQGASYEFDSREQALEAFKRTRK